MYLLYLDDSGSPQNKSESYFVLGGVAVFERQVHWLIREIEKLAATINPSNPEAIEFHASEIFPGRRPPWNGMTKEQRRNVLKDLLNILARSHESTRAFACAVHKQSFPGTDPIEMAFEQLCSRFDLLLKRLHKQGDTQRGLIILDRSSNETSLQRLSCDFQTLGTRWGTVNNLPEVPLFVDSKASRIIQLSDHIAYSVFRRYEAQDTSYFDIIASKFDSEGGRLHGLVHKQNNSPNCMCPACLSRKLSSS
jgi:hypothetical protein